MYKGIAGAIKILFIICCIRKLVEIAIWLFNHVSINWK